MSDLHAYMGFDAVGGPEEGGLLIFAPNRKEAMRIGRPWVMGWGAEFCHVRVHRLNGDAAHLRLQDAPHVIENPPSCDRCEHWSTEPLNAAGLCEQCAEIEADEDFAHFEKQAL